MKKNNIKKILIISTSTFAAVGTSATIGISTIANASGLNINSVNSKAVVNATFDPNKSLIFQGKTYKNIYHAIETYASNPQNVTEKMFLGDVIDATSITNKYETVNLSKLREYDLTKVTKAYKTLTDSYVSSIEEAKKSYLKEPVIAWTDNNGLIFDSEGEAEEHILDNTFTSPVNYYEIKDYANKDSNGNPRTVKINPLNKTDLAALKRIAAENALINDSGFTISRMQSDADGVYASNDFKGKSDQEIDSIVSQWTNGITNLVKKNIWLNNNVVAIPDVSTIVGWIRTGFANVKQMNFAVNYSVNTDPKNSSLGVDYDTYIKDSEYMTDKDKFAQKFDVYYDKRWNNKSKVPYRNAKIKGGQSIFGGQWFDFRLLDNQEDTMYTLGHTDSWMGEDVSFLGFGKQSNVFFSFNPNQEQFAKVLEDPTAKANWDQKAIEVYNQVRTYIQQNFKTYFNDTEINDILNSIHQSILDSITKKIIEKDNIWINHAKSSSQVRSGLDKIDGIVLNKINEAYKAKKGQTFSDMLREKVASKEQYVENKENNEIIYTIDYNGVPLFKMEKSLLDSLYTNSAEFKYQPLDQVKKLLSNSLKQNYQNAVKNITNSLTNISNSFSKTASPTNGLVIDTKLTKTAVDNYSGSSKQNNFGLVTKSITNNFGSNYSSKFIDESQFNGFGLNAQTLAKNLNAKDADDESLLYTRNGTFQAIYNYNKNLERYLSQKSPSQIQISTLTSNHLSDANDIVWLFNKDKTPLQIKYSEYFDNKYKFNQSLSDDSVSLVKSIESKERQIVANKLNKPTKVVVVKDYNGNIINFESVNGNAITNDGYATSKEQALENAKNQVDVKESLDYVFYNETDGTQTLLKNKVTKLNVLSINNNGTTSTYGFLKYQDLYNYLFDYIKLNSEGNGASLPDTQPPFTASSINVSSIANILSTVTSLDQLNKMTIEEKFNQFGGAFGISDLNAWKMYIKDLSFAPKQVSKRAEKQQATMSVKLNDGFKYADGTDTLNLDVEYTPASDLKPLPGVNGQSTQATTALIASVTSSILLILLLEVVLISVILINKRKQENLDEKKLMKLVNTKK